MQSRIDALREKLGDNEAVFISSYPNIFYYSGFKSEDAFLLISHDKQLLVTDSRYTIQAKQQSPEFETVDIKKGWEEIFNMIEKVRKAGTTVLLIEQNASIALQISDYAYAIELGRISLSGTGQELLNSEDVKRVYLGM